MIEFYLNDFIEVLKVALRHQLKNYVTNVRSNLKFAKLKGLLNLCAKLVETNKCNTFVMVYKLLKLTLLLPVTTVSVRTYDLLTLYNDVILAHFQQMDMRQFFFLLVEGDDFHCNVSNNVISYF